MTGLSNHFLERRLDIPVCSFSALFTVNCTCYIFSLICSFAILVWYIVKMIIIFSFKIGIGWNLTKVNAPLDQTVDGPL